jgi:hypothetical protein
MSDPIKDSFRGFCLELKTETLGIVLCMVTGIVFGRKAPALFNHSMRTTGTRTRNAKLHILELVEARRRRSVLDQAGRGALRLCLP